MGMFFFFLNGDKIRLTYVFTKTSDSGYAVCGAEVPLTKFIVDHHFPLNLGYVNVLRTVWAQRVVPKHASELIGTLIPLSYI